MVIVFVMPRNAGRIQRFLGPSGLNITTRLMGLILAAIAALSVIHGVRALYPRSPPCCTPRRNHRSAVTGALAVSTLRNEGAFLHF